MPHNPTNLTGFEGKDDRWEGGITGGSSLGGSGNCTVSTLQPRTGTHSLVLLTGGGIANFKDIPIRYTASGNYSSIDVDVCVFRGYFYLAQLGNSTHQIGAFLDNQFAAPVVRTGLEFRPDGFFQLNASGASPAVAISQFPAERWTRVEAFFDTDLNQTEFRIDGSPEATLVGFSSNDADSFRFGHATLDAGTSHIFFFDDVLIETDDSAANVDWPGPGQSVRMDPDSDGTYTGWTQNGAAADWDCVDEAPPDDDTTYIRAENSVVSASTVNLESASSAGIVGTINAVKSQALVRKEISDGEYFLRRRSGGVDFDLALLTLSLASGWGAHAKVDKVDPATSAAWTLGGLDAYQFGVGTDGTGPAGTFTRCTAVNVQVDYTPVAAGRARMNPEELGGKAMLNPVSL